MRRARLVAYASLVLAALVTLAPGPAPATAADKSFSLQSVTTSAVVGSDRSMEVTEVVVYAFRGGPFRYGIRSFLPADRSRITDFGVRDMAGRELPVIAPGRSESGEWEWELGEVSDATVGYQLRYRVAHAVEVGTDVGELYWQFLGRDHPGVSGTVDVQIDLPGEFPPAQETTAPSDATVVRAWGHGPRQGTIVVGPSAVRLSVNGVPVRRFVEARVVLPATAFPGPADSGPRLADVIREEGAFVDATLAEDEGRGPDRRSTAAVANLLAPGAGLLGLGALGVIWARLGREPRPDPMIGRYWREPLDDPPAVVLANKKKGTAPLGPAIGATLIDLAQRGYLSIAEETEQRWGPDKTVHRLRWKGKPTTGLAPFERELLEHVFVGRNEVTTDDVTAWASAHRKEAQAFAKDFQKKITEAYDARGYRVRARGAAMGWVWGTALAVGGIGLLSSALGGSVAVVAYAAAVVVAVAGSILVQNRTRAGADAQAKADALERFLRDFSNLEEAPAGHLVLWERFLVYAVTLGVAKELLQGLQTRLPAVMNDPAFGAWYGGLPGHHHLDHVHAFPTTLGAAAATAFAPPSRSGAGGGFSGGGGGGGGGGGFGAR